MLAGLLSPGTRRPATLRGSVAYRATLGDYCFQAAYDEALAGPEQDGILIKTNSGQNTGEEPASCSHLHSCFLRSGFVEVGEWS